MASDLNIPQFGTGATPGLNAPRMQAIWTFLKSIALGGSGSVINSDKLASTTPSAVGLSMLSAADKAAQQALVSLSEVSDSGLVAYWSMDSVPEIPDDPAGIVGGYLQDAWATVDGWILQGSGAVSVGSGKLYFEKTAINSYVKKTISVQVNSTIRAKVRVSAGTPENNKLYLANAPNVDIFRTIDITGGWSIVDFTVTGVPTTSIGLFVGSYSSANTYTLEVDFIYIGTGAYLPNSLIDNSGNGNHGTIYGATPVEGISGKALAFDGVKAYVQTAVNIPAIGSLSMWINPTAIDVGDVLITDNSGYFDIIFTTSTQIRGRVFDTSLKQTSVATISTGNWFHIAFIWTGSAIRLYLNGVVTGADVLASSPAVLSALVIAKQIVKYYNGTIDEPRIYNRALTAEEVYSLYMSKGRGPDCHVKSVAPLKDSLVVRDTVGNIQANGFKFPGTQVASTDPNTLDDYEEGVFTPGISFGGASAGITYTTQSGAYTKIGNKILFSINIVLSAKGSSVGVAQITGLPFIAFNSNNNYSIFPMRISSATFSSVPCASGVINSNTIDLQEITVAGVLTSITDVDFTASTNIKLSGHYYV